MIVTKFHENRLTIDRGIDKKNMRSWLITFNVTLGIERLPLYYPFQYHKMYFSNYSQFRSIF